MNERFAASQAADGGAIFRAVAELVRATDSGGDPLVRQETARLYTDLEVQRLTIARAVSAAAQGREPGPEGSVLKVLSARIPGRVTSLSEHLLGADGMLEGDWIRLLLRSPGARLGGGTDEIQKNIIGERVLGLPGEPRVDGGPFADRLRSSGGERRADGRR
jgi:alkylation response protein AidB-like acyl-CoA dehydrogenase